MHALIRPHHFDCDVRFPCIGELMSKTIYFSQIRLWVLSVIHAYDRNYLICSTKPSLIYNVSSRWKYLPWKTPAKKYTRKMSCINFSAILKLEANRSFSFSLLPSLGPRIVDQKPVLVFFVSHLRFFLCLNQTIHVRQVFPSSKMAAHTRTAMQQIFLKVFKKLFNYEPN